MEEDKRNPHGSEVWNGGLRWTLVCGWAGGGEKNCASLFKLVEWSHTIAKYDSEFGGVEQNSGVELHFLEWGSPKQTLYLSQNMLAILYGTVYAC